MLTRTPMMGPPYSTHGPRVPASCVLYVPKAQGSLPLGPHALCCAYGVRVAASDRDRQRQTDKRAARDTSAEHAIRTAYRVVHPQVDISNTNSILRSEALAACATWKSELASGNVPSQKSSMCTML